MPGASSDDSSSASQPSRPRSVGGADGPPDGRARSRKFQTFEGFSERRSFGMQPVSPPAADAIRTYTGRLVRPLSLRPEDVELQDIAHALSQLCRFTGHTQAFYSVAQHSVLVSHLVPAADALWALLHDASEAYLCDLARPVKHHPKFEPYRRLEAGVQQRIFAAFGLEGEPPASVKRADELALHAEMRDLMHAADGRHAELAQGVPAITPLAPAMAKVDFWARFQTLRRGADPVVDDVDPVEREAR